MQQIIMGVIMVIMGLAGLMITAGWIVPLILGIIGRRRHWPSTRVWQVLAIVWGGVALLLALGIGGAIFVAAQISGNYAGDINDNTPLFNATTYAGRAARLRLAYTGEIECVVQNQEGISFRCATSNGSLEIPAGAMTIRTIKITISDSKGHPWTASANSRDNAALNLDPDAVQDAKFGPPFLMAVNMEWAPVSSTIRLDPVCADRAGNIYKIDGWRTGPAPTFQLLDANQQVTWSGKFEAG